MDERVKFLTDLFKDKDWFHSVAYEQYGRIVVYVKYMNHETLYDIPGDCMGKHVLTHFAASEFSKADEFKVAPPKMTLGITSTEFVQKAREAQTKGFDTGFGQMVEDDIEELDSSVLELDLDDLCTQLDKLEKMCGSNSLQDIFYEVHDNRLTSGRNTVTNLSAKYPDVREDLERLYDIYGFNVIYEELDG